MRGVLIGADLMYRQDGRLVPIEINTNVGWDVESRVESREEVFDLDAIQTYVTLHNIEKIYLEGTLAKEAGGTFEEVFPNMVEYVRPAEFEERANEEGVLAIRTFYNDEAFVDSFCRDKINFLEAIKNKDFGSEYLLKTAEGFEGEITKVDDNGNLPNFILKYRYPRYDRVNYPALYKFNSVEELRAFAESNDMQEDFFLMPFYVNVEKLYNGRIQLIRNWSIFVANEDGDLDSIEIGNYTKLCGKLDEEQLVWDGNKLIEGRKMFITNLWVSRLSGDVMADSDDLVWMADGSWKEVKDLQVGDQIKSLDVPTEGDVDITQHSEVDYNISLEEFKDLVSFRTNEVVSIQPRIGFYDVIRMYFTDGTDWFDIATSSYPILDPEDGTVMFRNIGHLKAGDQVILMSNEDDINLQVREIERMEVERLEFEGYIISTDGSHLVLTRTSDDSEAYISIEHNASSWSSVGALIEYLQGKSGGCIRKNSVSVQTTCDEGALPAAVEQVLATEQCQGILETVCTGMITPNECHEIRFKGGQTYTGMSFGITYGVDSGKSC